MLGLGNMETSKNNRAHRLSLSQRHEIKRSPAFSPSIPLFYLWQTWQPRQAGVPPLWRSPGRPRPAPLLHPPLPPPVHLTRHNSTHHRSNIGKWRNMLQVPQKNRVLPVSMLVVTTLCGCEYRVETPGLERNIGSSYLWAEAVQSESDATSKWGKQLKLETGRSTRSRTRQTTAKDQLPPEASGRELRWELQFSDKTGILPTPHLEDGSSTVPQRISWW